VGSGEEEKEIVEGGGWAEERGSGRVWSAKQNLRGLRSKL
jgi:hypothetical protein